MRWGQTNEWGCRQPLCIGAAMPRVIIRVSQFNQELQGK